MFRRRYTFFASPRISARRRLLRFGVRCCATARGAPRIEAALTRRRRVLCHVLGSLCAGQTHNAAHNAARVPTWPGCGVVCGCIPSLPSSSAAG